MPRAKSVGSRRIRFFTHTGLLYSQVLILLVIPGVLVFEHAWGYDHHSYGLYAAVGLSPRLKNFTCDDAWIVRIDAQENWNLNSKKTAPGNLAGTLREQLGTRKNCAVYLDVDPSLPYEVAIRAIDDIQTTPAKFVVLVTPKTKKID